MRQAARAERTVISCGGGVVLDASNIECLKKNAVAVYLKASPDVILKRVGQQGGVRPLLQTKDPARTVAELLASRSHLYERAADLVIDTTGLTADEVAGKIMAGLPSYEGVNLKK